MLIILDRDGVINKDSDYYIKSPAEWLPIKGSLAAIARLKKAGHQVVVATNQSGVGRGLYTEEMLAAIHKKMTNDLAVAGGNIDGIYYCPHTPDDNCECRKPKAGLLEKIADDFQLDLTKAILIGDSLRDIQAAQAVGCPAVLVRTGKGQAVAAQEQGLQDVPIYKDLADVVTAILDGELGLHAP